MFDIFIILCIFFLCLYQTATHQLPQTPLPHYYEFIMHYFFPNLTLFFHLCRLFPIVGSLPTNSQSLKHYSQQTRCDCEEVSLSLSLLTLKVLHHFWYQKKKFDCDIQVLCLRRHQVMRESTFMSKIVVMQWKSSLIHSILCNSQSSHELCVCLVMCRMILVLWLFMLLLL